VKVRVKVESAGARVERFHKCRHEFTQTLESSRGSAPKLCVFFSLKVVIHYFPTNLEHSILSLGLVFK